jgi:hypothetical protein
MTINVVPSLTPTELESFAFFFHQDWKYVFPDFLSGTSMYLQGISSSRRARLASELHEFLSMNARAKNTALKQRWLKLGAQGWQSNLDVRAGLEQMLKLIEPL